MSEAAATPLEQLALDLVALPSVTGHEGPIADHVEAWLRAAGPARLLRAGHNLVAQARADRRGAPRVVLLGHLDTVPVSDANPPRLEGDRLYGLGASDMKTADALILDTLAWAAAGHSPYDVVVGLYAAEEGPYEISGLPELRAAAGDLFEDIALAVCMEPTDNALELGCLGTMHAWVKFEGQRAHSARPWQGRNAIHMAAGFLSRLAALAPREVLLDGLPFTEVASATMVRHAGARNVIPAGFDVNVNLRFAPDRDGDGARRHIEDLVRASVPSAWFDAGWITIEVTDLAPSGRVCRRNPLIERLVEVAGPGLAVRPKQAWTDVGRLSAWGIDAVNLGPGSGAQAHQVGEHASRRQLAEAQALVRRWLGSPPGAQSSRTRS